LDIYQNTGNSPPSQRIEDPFTKLVFE